MRRRTGWINVERSWHTYDSHGQILPLARAILQAHVLTAMLQANVVKTLHVVSCSLCRGRRFYQPPCLRSTTRPTPPLAQYHKHVARSYGWVTRESRMLRHLVGYPGGGADKNGSLLALQREALLSAPASKSPANNKSHSSVTTVLPTPPLPRYQRSATQGF